MFHHPGFTASLITQCCHWHTNLCVLHSNESQSFPDTRTDRESRVMAVSVTWLFSVSNRPSASEWNGHRVSVRLTRRCLICFQLFLAHIPTRDSQSRACHISHLLTGNAQFWVWSQQNAPQGVVLQVLHLTQPVSLLIAFCLTRPSDVTWHSDILVTATSYAPITHLFITP